VTLSQETYEVSWWFRVSVVAPEYMLCLHNGRFDQPDRMFNRWTILPFVSPADVKTLEYYRE